MKAEKKNEAILPGSTIGCLGGGQLGRMFALAARKMGYRVHTVDPTPDSPTGQISDREFNVPFSDIATLTEFARGVDVVTYEFENIPVEALDALARRVLLRPGREVLYTTQNRLREKQFLQGGAFPSRRPRRAERGGAAPVRGGARLPVRAQDLRLRATTARANRRSPTRRT
ncbi:MAG: hypothetical protein WDO13_05090 [Verrucomicrobiota bacterium]